MSIATSSQAQALRGRSLKLECYISSSHGASIMYTHRHDVAPSEAIEDRYDNVSSGKESWNRDTIVTYRLNGLGQ